MKTPADQASDFQKWMDALDAQIWNCMGVSIHDLPDQPFSDWYDDGMQIEEAVKEIKSDLCMD